MLQKKNNLPIIGGGGTKPVPNSLYRIRYSKGMCHTICNCRTFLYAEHSFQNSQFRKYIAIYTSNREFPICYGCSSLSPIDRLSEHQQIRQ